MTYRVEVSQRVQKVMALLPRRDQARIIVVLQKHAKDPRPQGCRAVRDAPKGTYRVRVGTYRVIYTVLDADQVIVVARVTKRDESTYRGLYCPDELAKPYADNRSPCQFRRSV